jgi:hypothetical protein
MTIGTFKDFAGNTKEAVREINLMLSETQL